VVGGGRRPGREAMTDPVVHLDGVTRLYEKGIGVLDLHLRVEPGTCYGLVGPNGAGKTTILRMVVGMLRPQEGSVRVFGLDPARQPHDVKQRVGYVAEDQTLPASLRPADLFRFFQSLYPDWDEDYEYDLVDRLELPLWRTLSRLSKGQRREVALVCALAHRPPLLVLDEPAGGLDPLTRRAFQESLVAALARAETTVLLSSHHLQEIERVTDRIGFLARGRLVLEGETADLQERACQVLVRGDGVDASALEGCLGAQERDGDTALTFLLPADEAERRVAEALGREVLQTQRIGLEDLFIALMRKRS